MYRSIPLFLLLIPFFLKGQGMLDGYLQKKGTADLAFSVTYQKASAYSLAKGNEIGASNQQLIGSFFASYGIFEGGEILVNIPFINKLDPDNGAGKFQDGRILFAYELFNADAGSLGRINLILGPGANYPLSDYETESASAIGQQAKGFLGRGVLQLDTRYPFFVNLRGGYDHMLGPVPSAYLYSATAGLTLDNFYMDLYYEAQHAIGGKNYRGTGNLEPDSFRELGVTYQKTGLTLYKPLGKGWGISLASSYILNGKNAWKNFTSSLGVVYQLKPDR